MYVRCLAFRLRYFHVSCCAPRSLSRFASVWLAFVWSMARLKALRVGVFFAARLSVCVCLCLFLCVCDVFASTFSQLNHDRCRPTERRCMHQLRTCKSLPFLCTCSILSLAAPLALCTRLCAIFPSIGVRVCFNSSAAREFCKMFSNTRIY